MSNKLYSGLSDKTFRSRAVKSVVDYWNSNKALVKKFGEIHNQKVFVAWQTKVIQNNKALLGVSVDGDGMYFEVTWNGDDKELYLDAYRKQKHQTIKY